jgi:hypothetical protein
VLVDQEIVRNGGAAIELWKFYDLGHGYCRRDRLRANLGIACPMVKAEGEIR